MFLLGALDLPVLWDEIWGMITRMNPQDADEGRRGLAEFEAKVGLSIRGAVLSHLDVGTLLVGNPRGRYVVVQRVKDGKTLDNKLLQLVNRIDLALAERREPGKVVRTELRKFTYRGTPCRYAWTMGVPALLLAGWAPCYADLGETFVFASHPLRLKRYLDFAKDGAPSILDNPRFQALRPAVPAGAAWVSYAEMTDRIARFYNTAAPFLMTFQGLAEQMELPQALDLANLPSSRVIRRYARGAITYGALEGDRYRIQGEGEGIDFLLPQVLAADPLAMLPAMVLPAITRARGEARRIQDRNNLNQIAKACFTYLMEHGDNRFYPSGLAELCDRGILERNVLVSPLDRNPPKLPNGVPCSYVTCFERHPDRQFLDAFPPNAMMAWDRMPFVRGMRNVLFFDSHVEFVPEERFQELLRELDELVKQEGATRERKEPPKRF
jgi:prepilin-type processing-associated H-X9-DG protein